MSEKVSQALIKMLNELSNIELDINKIKGAIFVRNSDKLIKEKIAYLYNLLKLEADTYNQKADKEFEQVERIVALYKDKLYKVYDEAYLQYVNIQNESGDARLNQKAVMINYQKVINDKENGIQKSSSLKEKLKSKNELYENIIERCNKQIEICIQNFEKQISSAFYIESKLQVKNDGSFIQKLINRISNLFSGNQKYLDSLSKYENLINQIDEEKIAKDFREQTIEFVADVLEMKDVELAQAV